MKNVSLLVVNLLQIHWIALMPLITTNLLGGLSQNVKKNGCTNIQIVYFLALKVLGDLKILNFKGQRLWKLIAGLYIEL